MLVDWLPWNHTFGGNHNVGLTLYNGGTLYIDDGKPTPALHGRDAAQPARDRAHDLLQRADRLRGDRQRDEDRRRAAHATCCRACACSSTPAPRWPSRSGTALHESAGARDRRAHRHGHRPGHDRIRRPSRSSSPTPTSSRATWACRRPGWRLKLVAMRRQDRGALQGPEHHAGLLAQRPRPRTSAFDEEGFFCTGDAVQWIDENDVHQGLRFDGRIAEDFKLATGTFVSVGPLRAKIIAAGAPYVQDAVITGINLKEVGALVFPTAGCAQARRPAGRRAAEAGAGKRRGAGSLPEGRRRTGRRRDRQRQPHRPRCT